jgi:threonylcarbamoyladenosine tRNA methylthiotransferase MtaB
MRRVAFRTVGCRLNQAETAQMAARFVEAGYDVVPFGEPCDLCVIHGCAVTRKAERESLRLARMARRSGAARRIALAGCVAQALPRERVERESAADVVADQREKWRLPAWLRRLPARVPATTPASDERPRKPDTPRPPPPSFDRTRATVKVQDGCEFGCAYCIVPAARGPFWSRPWREVVDEVRRLTDAGFREIVLTGANLASYADGRHGLAVLLRKLDGVRGLARIRLSSIEMSTVEREVVECMADSPRLCRHLHVPLQSGDDGVLAAMGRRYTAGDYARFVEFAVARVPELGLGTDLIAGFPGETDRAFANTLALARDLPFGYLHVFPYSERPGTRAADMAGRIPVAERKRRAAELLAIGEARRAEFARRFVGRRVAVLVESVDAGGTGRGWTGEYVSATVGGEGVTAKALVEAEGVASDGPTLHGRSFPLPLSR